MRRRLLLAATPLLALVLLALAVPAAIATAGVNSADLVRDRVGDASRFATALLTAPRGDDARLIAELDDYALLYETPVWLLTREGSVVHAAGGAPEPPESALDEITAVLTGRTPATPGIVWPWGPESVSIVAPIGYDSQVVAALVLDAPTDRVRRATGLAWLAIALLGLVPAAIACWLLWPLSRWVLRPVGQLERFAVDMARGDLDARVPADAGPPELRTLARSFNSMADVVSRTVTRQRQFVSDASHQLRTPLAGARLSVENLTPHLADAPDAQDSYRDAIDGLERMTGMVSGLLAATELEARPTGVAAIEESLVPASARWTETGERAGIRVTASYEPATVIDPAGGLVAVVDELVDNAVRLSGAGAIDIRGRRAGDRYVVSVTDDGAGFTADERAAATQRFWRSPKSQNVPGTGLGLGIVRQVIGDVGGDLVLDDAPGGGLRVIVEVPLVPPR